MRFARGRVGDGHVREVEGVVHDRAVVDHRAHQTRSGVPRRCRWSTAHVHEPLVSDEVFAPARRLLIVRLPTLTQANAPAECPPASERGFAPSESSDVAGRFK